MWTAADVIWRLSCSAGNGSIKQAYLSHLWYIDAVLPSFWTDLDPFCVSRSYCSSSIFASESSSASDWEYVALAFPRKLDAKLEDTSNTWMFQKAILICESILRDSKIPRHFLLGPCMQRLQELKVILVDYLILAQVLDVQMVVILVKNNKLLLCRILKCWFWVRCWV